MKRARWTNSDESYLSNNFGYYSNEELAERLGRSANSVQKKASDMKLKSVAQQEYAIYFDDEFKFIGNHEDCAKFLGVKSKSFRVYKAPSYKNDEGLHVVDLGRWKY